MMTMMWAAAILSGAPLDLETVLDSTRRHYPKLRSAEEKIVEAQGKLLGNRGAFDLKVKAEGSADPLGFYDKIDGEVSLEQGLSFGGIDLEGGYRYGEDFAPYDGKEVTSFSGEGFVGLNVPLVRNRAIDARRLGVRISQIGVDLANFDQRVIMLQTLGKATESYWKWVSSGQKLLIVERLLSLAEMRQKAVKRQVEQGSAPEILLRDNMRLILSRRELLVSAKQALNEAALKLSLFHRDVDGIPIVPTQEDLPEEFPDANGFAIGLEEDLAAIPATRPDLQFLEGIREQFGVERRFGENLAAPTIDVNVKASQDAGDTQTYGFGSSTERSRDETELGLKLKFELPVQRRKGRGEVMRTSAAMRRIDADLELALQTAIAELRAAFIRLEAAKRRIDLTRETYQLALQLEEAERRRFELGQSNLLFVNTREVMSANDASKIIDAQRDYQEALALYRVARGLW